jgi:hypothetical protein
MESSVLVVAAVACIALAALVVLVVSRRSQATDARLKSQLDAEYQRLAAQLGHDRATQDLAELRRLLDSAAAANRALSDGYAGALGALRGGAPNAQMQLDEFHRLLRAMASFAPRIALRVGDSPVTSTYALSVTAWQELGSRLGTGARDLSDADLRDLDKALEQVGPPSAEFLNEAYKLVASRPPR